MICTARAVCRAYTLVEVLVVVVILGICASMITPTMTGSQGLRVQAAVRTIVADITEMQSDALAFQKGRALVFHTDKNGYATVEINGTSINETLDTLSTTTFNRDSFGDAKIAEVDFDDTSVLIFDELGSPVTTPGGGTPSSNGTITITGAGEKYQITVEAYTGRVSVKKIS